MLVIIDYGLGNLASVLNMVRKVGGKAKVSNDLNDILSASKLILPGVGAFDHGVMQLRSLGFFPLIQEMALAGTPTLGICLGMQLLARQSEEGHLEGLGLIDAEFRKISFKDNMIGLRVPHVGWNHVSVVKKNPLIPNDGREQRYYFTHSYYAVCSNEEDVLATTDYGDQIIAAYSRGAVFGVQFHPEKSHRFGMALIKRFVEL